MYMDESSEFPKSWTLENPNLKLAVYLQIIKNSKSNGYIPLDKLKLNQKSYFYLQVSLKILNSGIILKTFTHACKITNSNLKWYC